MNNIFENSLRVRYGETDQMGFVYYGNYALYLEVARTEMLRNLGLSYAKLEKDGIQLPVVNMNVNYRKAARYDDLLLLKTFILEDITKKICFFTQIFNEANDLIATAEVTLLFVNKLTDKVITCPQALKIQLETYRCSTNKK